MSEETLNELFFWGVVMLMVMMAVCGILVAVYIYTLEKWKRRDKKKGWDFIEHDKRIRGGKL